MAHFDGKPLKSVTQGAAELALVPLLEPQGDDRAEPTEAITGFIAAVKATLGDALVYPLRVTSSGRG